MLLPSIIPNIKELRLHSMHLSDLLQSLLSKCVSLETLHISSGTCTFVGSISSPNLRKFVWKPTEKDELIIKDAPNLESLVLDVYTARDCKVKVLDAPKLQLLGMLHMNFKALQLGETFFDRQTTPGFVVKAMPCQIKTLSSVKTLGIRLSLTFNETIPDLLRCFPCLENFYIMNYETCISGRYSKKVIWDEQGSLDFLDHLKTVTMKGFHGDKRDAELLRYLVINGKVLKRVTLLCSKSKPITEHFVKNIRWQLCFKNRASIDLELMFFADTERCHEFSLWNQIIML
ncbi:hypothetical protein LUZ63_019220 [Rhynchospora breviuscula]|uniref:FBD domain-containing protein n=1 Tax=Rhynchospora breviuscula TaxID=2022672 RepID=A0A9Q0C621_9POAL|nr:hypothetical protein LUZ63_019220 [Rhynchospora breviuscula]